MLKLLKDSFCKSWVGFHLFITFVCFYGVVNPSTNDSMLGRFLILLIAIIFSGIFYSYVRKESH
jgi:hypothetical protein